MYEICNDEKRPSKDVTSVNTGFNTFRDEWLINPGRTARLIAQNIKPHNEYFRYSQTLEVANHDESIYDSYYEKEKISNNSKLNSSKHKLRVQSEKPTIKTMKQKLTIKIKSSNFKQKRNSNTNKICNTNLDEILDFMKLEISEKNSEKIRNIKREEEKYEKDIKALKKKLLFEQSNWKLLDPEIKHELMPKLDHYEG